MTLLLIALLPFAGAVLPPLLVRRGRLPSALGAGAVAAAAFGLLLSLAPRVMGGEVVRAGWDWIPEIGLRFSLMLDGLGLLFAGLVLGIGLLIVLYARYYLAKEDPMGRFYAYLLLFMGAMVGVVVSENLLVLLVFWELTSVSSFLLIGFWSHLAEGRQGARMALITTGLGGLAMMGGFLLLGQIVGSLELGVVLESGDLIRGHRLYPAALGLILVGAFTKSAQFPFHFWLPRAMAAPTPVSAYLHSATMVKAGVFLLARLHPALAGTELWTLVVVGVGITTMIVGAYIANVKHDLKGLLAYSTISHLGLITTLFGIGTKEAAWVGVFHIMNHAAFKASLFMNAGIVDHEAGTRDIRQLGGLRRLMPVTMVLALLASAAMAGFPPLNGFLSKELFLDETLHAHVLDGIPWLLPALATFGALLSVAYSIRYVVDVFFGEEPASFPHPPHDPPFGMTLAPAILVALCVAIGLFPNAVASPLLTVATDATVGGGWEYHKLYLWHGFTLPLFMSAAAIAFGALLWRFRWRLIGVHEGPAPLPDAKRVFDGVVAGAVALSCRVREGTENGSLQRYLAFIVATVLLLPGIPLLASGAGAGSVPLTPASPAAWAGLAILMTGAGGVAVFHRNRVVAIVFMGVVGLVSALAFVHLSAPDLALTQISVEVVTAILLLEALKLLPPRTPDESSTGRRVRDAVLAGAAGLAAAAVTFIMLTRPFESISDYYLEYSKPLGGGTNVVNVILVDFRGFDTFGEITVLGIAALGIYALIDGLGIPARWADSRVDDEDAHPVILVVAARILLPLALLVGLFLFIRGHNQPGGGFIAGLVVAVALLLQYLASGIGWMQERWEFQFHPLIASGLLVAAATGVGAMFWGYPFLKSWYDYFHFLGEFELASAALFDVGVFLTVVGAVMLTIVTMSKLPEAEGVRAAADDAGAGSATGSGSHSGED
jgi:multicomponent K+:H+ antiporter subunit A